MKKSIFLFFAAILCSVSAWAHNLAANQYVYFEKPSDWEAAQLLIGKSSWSEGYTMTNISNTNLYYLKTIKWDGYTEYYFFEKKDKWGGEGKSPTNRTPWTGKTSSKYTSAIAKCHLFNSTKSIKSSATASDYATVVNRTQTIKVQVKDGENWADATVTPADLTASTYALKSSTASEAKSASLAKESATVSATVTAAYSAKVTLSCTNVLDGYMFEGWYDANGSKITSYTVSDAHTVYARFIQSAEETNEVTVTYMCGTTSVATAINETVGVESKKSFTAPTVTGYKFTEWTIGAGIDLKAGTASDATITVVTKSASSDYTLVANYEEVLETVHFINAGKWSDVYLHLWNGNATGTEWPGSQLTATGEKIGEYDVYEYTAQQGAHANLLFHKKDNDSQKTTDLTWSNGVDKYYIYNYNGNTGWYTKAEAEALLVVPVVEETVYFVNNKNWTKVQAYVWNSTSNNTWPGKAMTATGEKVADYDVYSYTAPQGYVNVIFNNKTGETGVQSADFVWTNGKYYYMDAEDNYAGGTKEEVEVALAVPVEEETIYFVNNKNWSLVQIHAWKDAANNGWPGQALTATGEQVAGFDVYSFEAAKGTYTNLLFNNKVGAEGVQSSNYVWTADKYYYMGAAENYAGGTKEEVADLVTPDPLATEVYLAGDMTNKENWDVNKKEFRKATADATNASVTVTLEAQTYKFKLVVDGAWKGNTGIMQRGGDAVHEGGWSFDKDGYDDNCQIVADIAGDYTFTWDLNTKKLTVAYPPLPKYTVTAIAENGSVTGAGEYEQGSEATLVATPDAGYAFKNWTKDSEEVSTEATYTFTVTADVELVANFVPEETHEVTVSYLCGGNPIPGHDAHTLAVGVTTPSTITAPTIKYYKFDSWTLGTGVQSEDATTANPINITTKSEGEYTLTANYTKIELTYTVEVPVGTEKCYIAGDMTTEWSFVEMTKVDDTHFTITIEGATTEHKYKYAAGPAWTYVEKKADGSEADDRTYNANDVVKKWASVYDPSATYVLMGVNGDWDNGIALEVNPHNAAEYRLLCQPIVKANDAIKVVKISKGNKSYCANIADGSVETEEGSNGNIVLADGIYDFYYKIHKDEIYIATATNCYTRDVDEGKYGTICLPKAATNCNGATFFEVAGKEGDKVFFDEVTTLEAGVPYVFLAESNKIVLSQTGESADEAGKSKSLQGTFSQIDPAVDNVLVGNYMVVNNVIKKCGANCGLAANRAYFIATDLDNLGTPSALAPGRKRIAMGTTGAQVATGVDQVQGDEVPTKMIINGQLFILRGEKMYDAQGKLVK